jgi:hypothetical protein
MYNIILKKYLREIYSIWVTIAGQIFGPRRGINSVSLVVYFWDSASCSRMSVVMLRMKTLPPFSG